MYSISKGRDKEVYQILQANKAAAVGRLMLKEIHDWNEFSNVANESIRVLPRKTLKSAITDINQRLSSEIELFCEQNFENMDITKLSLLYDDIKNNMGLEIPLNQFEEKYSKIKPGVLQGNPSHLSICISLWGMQFKFPEDYLSKDLLLVFDFLIESFIEMEKFEQLSQSEIFKQRECIAKTQRKYAFAVRNSILGSYNLMEAYLNGIAWDYLQIHDVNLLSKSKANLLLDANNAKFRDKLLKYPTIISGKTWIQEQDEEFNAYIKILQPFRHSLVHSSPFKTPKEYGGYNKLNLFYKMNHTTAILSAELSVNLIERIETHLSNPRQKYPKWFESFQQDIHKKIHLLQTHYFYDKEYLFK